MINFAMKISKAKVLKIFHNTQSWELHPRNCSSCIQLNFTVQKLHDVWISLIDSWRIEFWLPAFSLLSRMRPISWLCHQHPNCNFDQFPCEKNSWRIQKHREILIVLFMKKPKLHISLLYKISLFYSFEGKKNQTSHVVNKGDQ